MFKKRLISIFSFVGIIAMAYLLWLHVSPLPAGESGVFCTIGEKVSCAEVNKSAYSQILGIPLSLMGLIYFATVFLISWLNLGKKYYWALSLGTIILLGPSIYLTYVEYAILQKFCLYCELSKAMMVGIVITAWSKSEELRPANNELFLSISASLLFAMLTFYLQT